MIDFTDPRALRWWTRRVQGALDLGADGFMQDFGEQVLLDMRFDDGSTGRTMHNRLPLLFHRATRRAIGGAYGFGTDIGGYFDVGRTPTTKELFLRRAQWAALTPIFRLHGSVAAGTHTPWSYARETVRIYRRLSRLHVAAGPLIARLWRRAARTGMPIARPLWLAVPGDRAAGRQDQEWLLGRGVLVAPVVHGGAHSRRVYFPTRLLAAARDRAAVPRAGLAAGGGAAGAAAVLLPLRQAAVRGALGSMSLRARAGLYL